MVNQASSDSELARLSGKLASGSLSSLHQDPLARKEAEKDGVGSASSRGLLLPSVQNMKTNVTEKMAQVSTGVLA